MLDADKKRLMRVKRQLNKKRPKFRRQESWRYKRVKPNWRRPRGIDSKMREKKRGYPPLVEVGYGSPRKVRYLHPSGYREFLVRTVEDLYLLDPTVHAARIAGTVGRAKREIIQEQAAILGIKVLNPVQYYEREVPLEVGEVDLEETVKALSLEEVPTEEEE